MVRSMTSSFDTKLAGAAMTLLWTVLTVVLFGYAIAESSLGALVLGALTLVQTWRAWSDAASHEDTRQLQFPN